jgi:hypothetical protein
MGVKNPFLIILHVLLFNLDTELQTYFNWES